MGDELNTDYILGKIDGHLESIDQNLEDGKKKMAGLQNSITKGFKEQNNKIHTIDKELGEHKQKGHHCHTVQSETRRERMKRHAPEIGAGAGLGTLIIGLLIALMEKFG